MGNAQNEDGKIGAIAANGLADGGKINATLLAHLEWSAKFLQPLIGGSAQHSAILATIASARGDTNARAALGEPQ